MPYDLSGIRGIHPAGFGITGFEVIGVSAGSDQLRQVGLDADLDDSHLADEIPVTGWPMLPRLVSGNLWCWLGPGCTRLNRAEPGPGVDRSC